MAEEAVNLLKDFYATGNPKGPFLPLLNLFDCVTFS